MYIAVAYQNSSYFAYSTDGITWTEDIISDINKCGGISICYGNDKFVTVAINSKYFAYYQKYYPSNLNYID